MHISTRTMLHKNVQHALVHLAHAVAKHKRQRQDRGCAGRGTALLEEASRSGGCRKHMMHCSAGRLSYVNVLEVCTHLKMWKIP
jgi:hypothetical protein